MADMPEMGISGAAQAELDISLDNIASNLQALRARLPSGAGIIAVVKDNAYGCGAVPVSRVLEERGVRVFAVARTDEARALRAGGIRSTILVLGDCSTDEIRWGASQDIHFSLNDLQSVDRWTHAGAPVRFHCNVDTGMGRLGLLPPQVPQLIAALKTAHGLSCVGAFTHFACADDPGTTSVGLQAERFRESLGLLVASGHSPACVHAANSAAILRFPALGFTHVRPGIALYGCRPAPAQDFGADLKTVVKLRGPVVKLKLVPAGTTVSYGWHYTTPGETVIATIALGYAHGLPRFLSSKGHLLIGGNRYRIAGNVTMDYCMVDAGPAPAITVGDEAVAIGYQGSQHISADEVAQAGNTIGYEVLCRLSTALRRTYLYQGAVISRREPLCF